MYLQRAEGRNECKEAFMCMRLVVFKITANLLNSFGILFNLRSNHNIFIIIDPQMIKSTGVMGHETRGLQFNCWLCDSCIVVTRDIYHPLFISIHTIKDVEDSLAQRNCMFIAYIVINRWFKCHNDPDPDCNAVSIQTTSLISVYLHSG